MHNDWDAIIRQDSRAYPNYFNLFNFLQDFPNIDKFIFSCNFKYHVDALDPLWENTLTMPIYGDTTLSSDKAFNHFLSIFGQPVIRKRAREVKIGSLVPEAMWSMMRWGPIRLRSLESFELHFITYQNNPGSLPFFGNEEWIPILRMITLVERLVIHFDTQSTSLLDFDWKEVPSLWQSPLQAICAIGFSCLSSLELSTIVVSTTHFRR